MIHDINLCLLEQVTSTKGQGHIPPITWFTHLRDGIGHYLPELPLQVSQAELLVQVRDLAVELPEVRLGIGVHLEDVADAHLLGVLVDK